MTLLAGRSPGWALADFLDWEETQDARRELVDGLIRAMVGGTPAHSTIARNIATTLKAALRGTPCRVYMEGVKLVTRVGEATYPDVVVTCGHASATGTRIEEATVVVEILSRGTEGLDRGAKWRSYRSLPMLRHYVLVAQTG